MRSAPPSVLIGHTAGSGPISHYDPGSHYPAPGRQWRNVSHACSVMKGPDRLQSNQMPNDREVSIVTTVADRCSLGLGWGERLRVSLATTHKWPIRPVNLRIHPVIAIYYCSCFAQWVQSCEINRSDAAGKNATNDGQRRGLRRACNEKIKADKKKKRRHHGSRNFPLQNRKVFH